MATPLAANDLLEVLVACRVAPKAQIGLSNLVYRVFNAAGANLEDVPRLLFNRFSGPYRDWLPTQAVFQGVSVRRIATAVQFAAGPFYHVFNLAGGVSGGMLPMQVSGLIRKTTPGDSEHVPPIVSAKGRIYVPFPAVTSYNSVDGVLSAGGLQRLQSVQAVIGTDVLLVGGARLRMSMKRTKTNPFPEPPTLLGYTDVTALTSLAALATQRRRGDFGRINAAFGGIL